MKTVRFCFLLLICIGLRVVQAQKPSMSLPNPTFHSPNVASLGMYGDYSVNKANGVPEIGVSLYTVKGQKLELPISLSYHASGIKVDQEASFVGLGWALQSGGVITRAIKGKPDETQYGFANTGNAIATLQPDMDEYGMPATIGNNPVVKEYFTHGDGQPDIYSVNAVGVSGEFCLDNNLNYVCLDNSAMTFEYNRSQELIIVKDKSGNIFRFGLALDGTPAHEDPVVNTWYVDLDNTSGTEQPNLEPSVPTAWYLTEIISGDLSDTIFFKYEVGHHASNLVTKMSRYMLNDGMNQNVIDAAGRDFDGKTVAGIGTSVLNQQVPSEIHFRNGKVKFIIASERLDFQPFGPMYGKYITGIEVYDRENQLYKKIVLDNNHYFNRTGNGKSLWGTMQEYSKKALRLNGVKFYDKSNVFQEEFEFEYDETSLAPFNSSAQDFWGYYNGKHNESLIPSTFTLLPNGTYTIIGEDRTTNFNYMKAATLTRIKYPTGGSTLYEYEPHYYTTAREDNNTVRTTKQMDFFAVSKPVGATCEVSHPEGPVNAVYEFTVTEDVVNGAGSMYIFFTDYINFINNQEMTARVSIVGSPSDFWDFKLNHTERLNFKAYNRSLFINKGSTYRVELNTNGAIGSNASTCNWPWIQFHLAYDYWAQVPVEQVKAVEAGGLRVKIATNYSSDNKILSQKKYEYGDMRLGKGTGKLISEPDKYFYRYPLLYKYDNGSGGLRNVVWFTSESQAELGMNHGCPVEYDKVVEREVDYQSGQKNGKAEYYYSSFQKDYEPKSSYYFPFDTYYFPGWKTKNLNSVKTYKTEANGTDKLIQDIVYDYTQSQEFKIRTAVVHEVEPDTYISFSNGTGGGSFNDNPKRFQFYNYYESRARYMVTKETIKDYVSDTKFMTKEKLFAYNPQYDLSSTSTKASNGDIIETKNKYTADLNYTSLIEKNMLSLPVLEEVRVNGKVKNGTILTYNDFGGVTEQYKVRSKLPVTAIDYTTVTGIPNYYEKISSLLYNPDNKRVREAKTNDQPTSVYLYSYRNTLPVAEIVNADYATVESVLGATNINAYEDALVPENAINSFLAPLRTDARLKNAKIKIYTSSPLVGMLSVRDENNKETRYEYDDYARLIRVRDYRNNILQQNEYKLKTEVANQTPPTAVMASNSTSKKIVLNFVNTVTSESFQFTLNAGATHVMLGVIPAASYNVTMAQEGGSTDLAINYKLKTETKTGCADVNFSSVALAGTSTVLVSGLAAGEPDPCGGPVFRSARVVGDFYSELCTYPDEPEAYAVDIAEGAFTSPLSQAAADYLAWTHAQHLANQNGDCTDMFELVIDHSRCNFPGYFIYWNYGTNESEALYLPANFNGVITRLRSGQLYDLFFDVLPYSLYMSYCGSFTGNEEAFNALFDDGCPTIVTYPKP